MKNFTKIMVLFVSVFLVASQSVFAATATSGPVNISASVDGTLTLSVALKKNNSVGATIPSMDFGQLIDIGTGTLRSSAAGSTLTGNVTAMISANSHGLPYAITQTGTTLSNGATTLPSGACTVVPVYASADNGGAALVGTLGTKGPWAVSGKTLYTSDAAGSVRTIQAIYSVTDDPASGATTGVPLSQAGGTYSGTVTFTVTA